MSEQQGQIAPRAVEHTNGPGDGDLTQDRQAEQPAAYNPSATAGKPPPGRVAAPAPDDSVQYSRPSPRPMHFAWLEITRNCQLTCEHCYVASKPGLGHGKMKVADWKDTLNQLRSMGVTDVQFIGGEPTTHPHFCELLDHAAELGFTVEVYSNLVSITQPMWSRFISHGINLATSFYSTEASLHDEITTIKGSYRKTLANMMKAIALGLNLRVGIIQMREEQDIPGAEEFLTRLGVDPNHIGVDRVRGVGRGFNLSKEDNVSALCGKCLNGNCVITAEGVVYPCIMARTFPIGNILRQSIADIYAGDEFRATYGILSSAFEARDAEVFDDEAYDDVELQCDPCNPFCNPNCNPHCNPNCRPSCDPNCSPRCGPQCQPNCSPHCRPSCGPSCSPNCQPNCRPCQPNCRPSCNPFCDPGCRPPCNPCSPNNCSPESWSP